MVIGVEIGQ